MGFNKLQRFRSRTSDGRASRQSTPLIRIGSMGSLGSGSLMRGWHSRSGSEGTENSFEYDDDEEADAVSIASESDFGDWGSAPWEGGRSGGSAPQSSSKSGSNARHPELDGIIFRAVPTPSPYTSRAPTVKPYKKVVGRQLRIEHVDHMKHKNSPCRPSPIAELPSARDTRYTYNSFVPMTAAFANPGYQEWQDSHYVEDDEVMHMHTAPVIHAAAMCSRFGHQVDQSPYTDTRYRDERSNGMVAVMGWLGKKKCRRCGRNVKA